MPDTAPPRSDGHIYSAFAEAAVELSELGVIVFPVGGGDGKVPLIEWGRLRRRLGAKAIEKFVAQFPGANIGIATGASRFTVIDLDDRAQKHDVEMHFGPTPLVVETPSGGLHFFYRNSGEGCRNLRSEGLAVDVKGMGGFVVAPPSMRVGGAHGGQRYRFIRGSWADLSRLPTVKPGSLRRDGAAPRSAPPSDRVKEGARNNTLFRLLLREVRGCDTEAELHDKAVWLNETCDPPLPESEIEKLAKSVWHLEQSGNNWVGRGALDVIVRTARDELKQHQHGPDALFLFMELRAVHFDRPNFAASPKAMAEAQVFTGWGPARYRNALAALIEVGLLRMVHRGGRRKGDPHLYAWGRI